MSNYTHRTPRRESTAGFANHSEAGMGGGIAGGTAGFSAAPRNTGGYPMGGGIGGGYAPAATDTTPQKNVVRDEYGNHSPPLTEDHYKHRAK